MTVAPVEVMPDIASNIASAGERSRSEKASGMAAKEASTTQTSVVRRNAWRPVSSPKSGPRFISTRLTPANRVTAPAARNTCQSGWPTAMSAIIGGAMKTARMIRRMPITKKIGRRSSTI